MTPQRPATGERRAARESHAAPATTPPPPRKSEALRSELKPGQRPDDAMAELVVAGLAANAVAAVNLLAYGKVDVTACFTRWFGGRAR